MDRGIATSWRRDVPCFRCGAVAAALTVDYESAGRGVTVTLDGFLARKTSFLSVPAAEELADVDAVELPRWLPPGLHGFVCRECGAAYCRSCWTVGEPLRDDEGEYAGRAGTCPSGHEAIVDQ